MKLSPIYVEKLAESKQIGFQEGIQQEIALIMRLLKRKIGELPVSLETEITKLPLKTLEDLGEALLDFNSLTDLNNWLKNN